MTGAAPPLPVSLVALLATGLTIFSGLLDRLVEGMLFQPTPGVDFTPEELGIEARGLFLRTADDVAIHAFELPQPGAGTARGERAILFLHGNYGNASHRLPNAAQMAALGARVLLIDYRGYGRSEGRPTIPGVVLDAEAGLAHLLARGLPLDRIVVFGRSVGGAVAVQLARERPLAGVILESTFSSMADVARSHFGPTGAWAAGSRFDSLRAIRELRAPLLVLHGDRDDIVPQDLGRRLFEAAPEPKRFVSIRGAGHNDTVSVGGADYLARLGAFLDEVAPRTR